MKRELLIDCDPGTDDAIALIAACGNPDINIRAVTTVCGNVNLNFTSQNTLDLLAFLKLDIPVAIGAEGPLLRNLKDFRAKELDNPSLYSHGNQGMGNLVLPPSTNDFSAKTAVETIYEEAKKCKGNLEIIATGPLTNLALALCVYPELKQGLIKKIYFMGGAVCGGNSTAVAEFNVFFDPEAAKIVLDSGIPLLMVGLDVTMKSNLTDEDCQVFEKMGTPAAQVTHEILKFMQLRRDKYDGEDVIMHDALVVGAALDPQIIKTRAYYVDVELSGTYTYGHTYVQRTTRLSNKLENCSVAYDVDVERFKGWLQSSVAQFHSS